MPQMMSQNLTDEQYALADAIELALEEHAAVRMVHPVWQIAKWMGGEQDASQLRLVLAWMEEHQYLISNGAGGCWRRYGRRK
jgi:hypothetical protein